MRVKPHLCCRGFSITRFEGRSRRSAQNLDSGRNSPSDCQIQTNVVVSLRDVTTEVS